MSVRFVRAIGGLPDAQWHPPAPGQRPIAAALFDYARQNDGTVRVRGVSLDGQIIDLDLNPARFTGTAPSRHGELPN
jgi:hypothetical protein